MSSRVISEVAIGAAAIVASFIPGIDPAVSAYLLTAGESMVAAGAMEGISEALQRGQGGLAVGMTTPIGPWGYVYGTQKVGGIEIFRQSNNSTGGGGSTSNWKQLHRVYALACHPSVADSSTFQLRIDGKQVLLRWAGPGWQSYSPTQSMQPITSISRDANGLVTLVIAGAMEGLDGQEIQITESADNTLNGIWIITQPNPADYTTFSFISGGTPTPAGTNPGGQFWTLYADYQDKIHVEFLNGNHTSTFPTLLAAGTNWSATDLCLGRTLVYVQMGWSSAVFPSSIPNVSFLIQGKNNIFDPRTGTYGYTNNAALCIADFLSLPATQGGFGLTIGTDIPTAQLIAAANICDEQVPLAAGGSIARYTCDIFFMLSASRGKILQDLLTSCAGRLSYQGGQFSIFPGAWVAPTLQLTEADIMGTFKWKPRLSIRDACNGVKGTYVSPENDYQAGDFPAYMQDYSHGYGLITDPGEGDAWLAEDQLERIFKEINLPCTSSAATAQRLAKIELLRTRFQMRGTIRCSMKAYQAVALDVIQITHPRYTWLNKNFEVLCSRFVQDKSGDVPVIAVELDLAETDPTIYDWSIAEELTPQGYAQPSNVGNSVCVPPANVVIYSGPGTVANGVTYPSTITTGANGVVQNSLYVAWKTPNDANVVQGGYIEVQWQPAGASAWTAWGQLAPPASCCFISPVNEGAAYNVQVRAVNCAGVPSQWVVAGPETVSDTLSVFSYSGTSVAPSGTLIAQAFSDGTAAITVLPFTPSFYSSACTPTPAILTGLAQAQMYYVYYVDPTLAGGIIVPIATQIASDFLQKAGYFLIGQITTPSYVPRYKPSSYSDSGAAATSDPAAAYDGNPTTAAIVPAAWTWVPIVPVSPPYTVTYQLREGAGVCTWGGFPNVVTTAPATLNVMASVTKGGSSPISCVLSAAIAGTSSTLATFTTATGETVYTLAIPPGTNLSQITVTASPSITAGAAPGNDICAENIFEIYIQ
jgi:hypothetical protein